MKHTIRFLFILILAAIGPTMVQAQIASEEFDYFFHWSGPGRHQMLIKFGKFLKKYEETVFGNGSQSATNPLNGMAVQGRGLYLAGDSMSSKSYGDHLTVVAVPKNAPIRLYDKKQNFWILQSADPRVRFVSPESFVQSIVSSSIIQNISEDQIIALNQAIDKMNRPDLKIRLDRSFHKSHGYSLLEYESKIETQSRWSRSLDFYRGSQVKGSLPTISPDIILAMRLIDREHLSLLLENERPRVAEELKKAPLSSQTAEVPDLYTYLTTAREDRRPDYYITKAIAKYFPLHAYGEAAFKGWTRAYLRMSSEAIDRPLELRDLLSLHQIAYSPDVGDFHSFLMSQINGFPKSQRAQALQMLKDGKYLELYKRIGTQPPRGQLRTGPIYISSSYQNLDGSRERFTHDDLQVLALNPQLEVNEKKGTVKFKYNPGFAHEVQELIESYREEAIQLKSQRDRLNSVYSAEAKAYFNMATELATNFYHDLISRHIFWDGAGRTSKLARDWMLIYLGLTPPLSTPRNDLILTRDQLKEDLQIEIAKSNKVYFNSLLYSVRDLIKEGPGRRKNQNSDAVKVDSVPPMCRTIMN